MASDPVIDLDRTTLSEASIGLGCRTMGMGKVAMLLRGPKNIPRQWSSDGFCLQEIGDLSDKVFFCR